MFVLIGLVLTISVNYSCGTKKGGIKMKKILTATITVFLTVMIANAQAAQVTINPGSVVLDIKPGQFAEADLEVIATNIPFPITLTVGNRVFQGPIQSWITPVSMKLQPSGPISTSSSMKLKVTVPPGTEPNTYTATLPVQAFGPVATQNITLTVKVPKKCNGAPDIENVEVSPNDIWAPKTGEVAVTVSGTTVVTPGCEVTGTYSLQSNDGLKEGKFTIDPDGKFSVKINGKFSKKGTDKNGKDANVYNGLLTLTDEANNSRTQGFWVEVAHDRRK